MNEQGENVQSFFICSPFLETAGTLVAERGNDHKGNEIAMKRRVVRIRTPYSLLRKN
jgi:hypothetical protein